MGRSRNTPGSSAASATTSSAKTAAESTAGSASKASAKRQSGKLNGKEPPLPSSSRDESDDSSQDASVRTTRRALQIAAAAAKTQNVSASAPKQSDDSNVNIRSRLRKSTQSNHTSSLISIDSKKTANGSSDSNRSSPAELIGYNEQVPVVDGNDGEEMSSSVLHIIEGNDMDVAGDDNVMANIEIGDETDNLSVDTDTITTESSSLMPGSNEATCSADDERESEDSQTRSSSIAAVMQDESNSMPKPGETIEQKEQSPDAKESPLQTKQPELADEKTSIAATSQPPVELEDRSLSSPDFFNLPKPKIVRTYVNKRKLRVDTSKTGEESAQESVRNDTSTEHKDQPTDQPECRRSSRQRIIKYEVRDLFNMKGSRNTSSETKNSRFSHTQSIRDSPHSDVSSSPQTFRGFSDTDDTSSPVPFSKMRPKNLIESFNTTSDADIQNESSTAMSGKNSSLPAEQAEVPGQEAANDTTPSQQTKVTRTALKKEPAKPSRILPRRKTVLLNRSTGSETDTLSGSSGDFGCDDKDTSASVLPKKKTTDKRPAKKSLENVELDNSADLSVTTETNKTSDETNSSIQCDINAKTEDYKFDSMNKTESAPVSNETSTINSETVTDIEETTKETESSQLSEKPTDTKLEVSGLNEISVTTRSNMPPKKTKASERTRKSFKRNQKDASSSEFTPNQQSTNKETSDGSELSKTEEAIDKDVIAAKRLSKEVIEKDVADLSKENSVEVINTSSNVEEESTTMNKSQTVEPIDEPKTAENDNKVAKSNEKSKRRTRALHRDGNTTATDTSTRSKRDLSVKTEQQVGSSNEFKALQVEITGQKSTSEKGPKDNDKKDGNYATSINTEICVSKSNDSEQPERPDTLQIENASIKSSNDINMKNIKTPQRVVNKKSSKNPSPRNQSPATVIAKPDDSSEQLKESKAKKKQSSREKESIIELENSLQTPSRKDENLSAEETKVSISETASAKVANDKKTKRTKSSTRYDSKTGKSKEADNSLQVSSSKKKSSRVESAGESKIDQTEETDQTSASKIESSESKSLIKEAAASDAVIATNTDSNLPPIEASNVAKTEQNTQQDETPSQEVSRNISVISASSVSETSAATNTSAASTEIKRPRNKAEMKYMEENPKYTKDSEMKMSDRSSKRDTSPTHTKTKSSKVRKETVTPKSKNGSSEEVASRRDEPTSERRYKGDSHKSREKSRYKEPTDSRSSTPKLSKENSSSDEKSSKAPSADVLKRKADDLDRFTPGSSKKVKSNSYGEVNIFAGVDVSIHPKPVKDRRSSLSKKGSTKIPDSPLPDSKRSEDSSETKAASSKLNQKSDKSNPSLEKINDSRPNRTDSNSTPKNKSSRSNRHDDNRSSASANKRMSESTHRQSGDDVSDSARKRLEDKVERKYPYDKDAYRKSAFSEDSSNDSRYRSNESSSTRKHVDMKKKSRDERTSDQPQSSKKSSSYSGRLSTSLISETISNEQTREYRKTAEYCPSNEQSNAQSRPVDNLKAASIPEIVFEGNAAKDEKRITFEARPLIEAQTSTLEAAKSIEKISREERSLPVSHTSLTDSASCEPVSVADASNSKMQQTIPENEKIVLATKKRTQRKESEFKERGRRRSSKLLSRSDGPVDSNSSDSSESKPATVANTSAVLGSESNIKTIEQPSRPSPVDFSLLNGLSPALMNDLLEWTSHNKETLQQIQNTIDQSQRSGAAVICTTKDEAKDESTIADKNNREPNIDSAVSVNSEKNESQNLPTGPENPSQVPEEPLTVPSTRVLERAQSDPTLFTTAGMLSEIVDSNSNSLDDDDTFSQFSDLTTKSEPIPKFKLSQELKRLMKCSASALESLDSKVSDNSAAPDGSTNIRRSHRIKTQVKSTVGRGLVRDKSDRNQNDSNALNLEAQNAKFLKDMEERLSQFQMIKDNEYKCERTISKEAKRMTCDCFLTREEEQRGELGCGEDCLNRLLMIECSSKCTVGDRCTNRRFQKNQYAPCKVFRTEKKGFGIMADREIAGGEFIMEYVGEVLNGKQFEKRAELYCQDKNKHFYFMALRGDCIIDATQRGSISRFINHSCDPNAETQKWTVNGELRIGFFSRRTIYAGEEITFDYQFQRYGKEAQRCFCESANCRGWIGEEPDSDEEEDVSSSESEEETEEKPVEEEKKEIEMEKIPEPAVVELIAPVAPQPVPPVETTELIPSLEQDEARQEPIQPVPVPAPAALPKPIDKDKLAEKNARKARRAAEKFAKIAAKMKARQERELNKQKNRMALEDNDLEEEILSVEESGLKNQVQTLKFSRCMVRVKHLESKMRLLNVLRNGDVACKRLFLDYHGLRLLHGWVSENETSDMQQELNFRRYTLLTLEHIPIPNKTMLKDSKVFDVVQNWLRDARKQLDSSPSTTPDYSPPPSKKIKSDTHAFDAICEEIKNKALKLTAAWEDLPEVFRIPKRERIEQMKEHEREANRRYKALGLGDEDTYNSHIRNKARFGSQRMNKWSRDKHEKRREFKEPEKVNSAEANLTKLQRRQLFAAKVAKDEADKRLAEEHREFEFKCKFYGLDMRAMTPNTMPFCVNPSTGQWYSKEGNKIETPPSHAHIKIPPKPQSTDPNDYNLPEMDLPPMWTFAIDPQGRIYYYHVKIRIAQWEPPIKIPPLTSDSSADGAEEVNSIQSIATIVTGGTSEPQPSTSRAAMRDDRPASSESDDTDSDISCSEIIGLKKGYPLKVSQDTIEQIERSRKRKRFNRLVQERTISPRREEDRAHNQIEMRRYRENKEKIRRRKELIKRRKMQQRIEMGETSLNDSKLDESTQDASTEDTGTVPIQDYLLSSDEEDDLDDKSEYNNSLIEKIVHGDNIVDELDAIAKEKPLKRPLPFINHDAAKKRQRLDDRRRLDGSRSSDKPSKSRKAESKKPLSRKAKERFRSEISGVVAKHLSPYRRDTCQIGRITNNEDFKHLTWKLTHFVLVKECRHCEITGQSLVFTESVKNKSREFIKKYMAKHGEVYVRPPNDQDYKDMPL